MFLSMKPKRGNHKSFVLQKVQPALLRLMDSAVSTLAPIFAVAGLTGKPEDAFFVGLAASLGRHSLTIDEIVRAHEEQSLPEIGKFLRAP
jgi:hypothetical protein